MTYLHILFPVCAVTPVVINAIAVRYDRHHSDALALSLMILTIWACQMILSVGMPIPDRQALNPMFDLMGGLAALGCWVTYRRTWMLVLSAIFAAQCVLAATFWWGWEIFNQSVPYTTYLVANNMLWLLQLVCVSVAGGWSVARRLIDSLRHSLSGDRGLGVPT